MNVWTFTGFLGKDAERSRTEAGAAIVRFSVAVKSGFGARESVVWARCSMFGKHGEALFPYLRTGKRVAVTGELSIYPHTTQEGEKVNLLDVFVKDLELLTRKEEDFGTAKESTPRRAANPSYFSDPNDDIPF